MKPVFFVIFFWGLLSGGNCLGQNQEKKTATKYFSKIVVEPGDSMFVETDTLLVDTLIMRDRAKLNFLRNCVLGISHAFMGDRCEFNAAGEAGENGNKLDRFGQSGNDGRDLRISIRFEKLGNLTILATGGKGGYGLDGQNSLNPYESGENGGRGGDGGRGGNVDLFYLSPNFIVVVDEQSKHSSFYVEQKSHAVFLSASGGDPGQGGKGGAVGTAIAAFTPVGVVVSGSREATKGRNGNSGSIGMKGTVRFLKTE